MKTAPAKSSDSEKAARAADSSSHHETAVPARSGLLTLQQKVGNRTVSRLVDGRSIQRHGNPEDEPLQALHDRALQRHGAPEDEPLQALHDGPGLVRAGHNGHVRPGSLQRVSVLQRVDTGIARGKSLSKYIGSIKKLKPDWKKLGANARAAELGKAANSRLKDADVEPCAINVKAFGGGTNGQFDFTTWTIDINQTLVQKDDVTDDELADAADTMYHEARHAEQWFRIARWLGGTKGKAAAEIAAEMAIPDAVAKKACAKGLKESGKTAKKFMGKAAIAYEKQMLSEAAAWHQNIYGTGRTERNATLNNLGPTGDAYTKAKKDYDDNYVNAVKANQDAEKKYLDANDAYELKAAEWDKAYKAYKATVKGGAGGVSELFAAKALEMQLLLLEGAKDQAFKEWEDAYKVVETLDKNLDQATKDAIAAHAKYKALVEEADAWALGDRVKKAYSEKVAG